jgi:hypothetical protein
MASLIIGFPSSIKPNVMPRLVKTASIKPANSRNKQSFMNFLLKK